MLALVDAPFLYSECPACFLPIRHTLQMNPDGTLIANPQMFERGIRLHLVYACEAVQR